MMCETTFTIDTLLADMREGVVMLWCFVFHDGSTVSSHLSTSFLCSTLWYMQQRKKADVFNVVIDPVQSACWVLK